MDKITSDLIRGTNAEKPILRKKRAELLKSFDVYKVNVEYGIQSDDDRNAIIEWYNDILELKPSAFNNVPEKIAYYMEVKNDKS